MTGARYAPLLAFASVLATAAFLYLQNLGSAHVTVWDEIVHVNVIRNLAEHCCTPQLHRLPVGTDFRDWANNTVWVHKPLLPFYISAVFYRGLGSSLFVLRLPGAIYALLITGLLYLMGGRHFGRRVGFSGAAIFALNPYTDALVHGREFSGFSDLAFALLVVSAFFLILEWITNGSSICLWLLGLIVGLGYLCKGGLALAPVAVLAIASAFTRGVRRSLAVVRPLIAFVLVVFPERLYWSSHYPREFGYEQRQQLMHLFASIEGHGAPWHLYLTRHLPFMLLPAAVPFVYFAIAWATLKTRPGQPALILNLWVLIYLVPLSFGVSKIENFIFPILPAIALLVPYVLERLIAARARGVILWLCLASLVVFALTQAAAGTVFVQFNRATGFAHPRFIAAAVATAAVGAPATFLAVRRIASARLASGALLVTASAIFVLYVTTDLLQNTRSSPDAQSQQVLRETAVRMRSYVTADSLVLAHYGGQDLAYLYLMYWSGADVLDVCREPDAGKAAQRFRNWHPLFLISPAPLPVHAVAQLPIGGLYPVDGIPFQAWKPAAISACPQNAPKTRDGPAADQTPGRSASPESH